ncbi:hypothetical protein AF332_16155 [Sporosarcina globispora]|uniref:Uncharacterized protein n=1 Tax=Sporosarcina globispora TaxID=1459 RepID=A0A0M0GE36_SPOGL|nr:hypothetical protein AF332_16155 [Sporosarcina globispora]
MKLFHMWPLNRFRTLILKKKILYWRNQVCILKCGLTSLDRFAILAKGIWRMPLNRLTIQSK